MRKAIVADGRCCNQDKFEKWEYFRLSALLEIYVQRMPSLDLLPCVLPTTWLRARNTKPVQEQLQDCYIAQLAMPANDGNVFRPDELKLGLNLTIEVEDRALSITNPVVAQDSGPSTCHFAHLHNHSEQDSIRTLMASVRQVADSSTKKVYRESGPIFVA